MKTVASITLEESSKLYKTIDERRDVIHIAAVDQFKKIAELRQRFRPALIKILFVAESPPESKKNEDLKFFYNPAQTRNDNLFHSIMKVVFPDYEIGCHTKGEWLERFKGEGFFLIDATEIPLNRKTNAERNSIIKLERQEKVKEIKQLISQGTKVILIKKNIFHLLANELSTAGVQLLNRAFLPFPSHGHERRFVKECRALILVEQTDV